MADRKLVIRKSPKVWLRKRFFFVWVAENGERTGRSQMYLRHSDVLDEANRTAAATYTVHDESLVG